jgi:uncharacterized protein
LKISLRVRILASSLLFSSAAFPAGFNCSKAFSQVEHLICSAADLSSADEQLSSLYKQVKKDNPIALTRQRLWLKERNACTDVNCLRKSYHQRLMELAGKSQPKSATRPSIKSLSENQVIKPITQEFLDNLSVKASYSDGTTLKYRLKKGIYTQKAHFDKTGNHQYPDTTVAISMIAFGDLNKDKVDDAAVIFSNNTGGNDTTYSLTGIVAKAGKPLATPSVELGNTLSFKQFRIESGRIVLMALTHGKADSFCCSYQKATYWYRVNKNALVAFK